MSAKTPQDYAPLLYPAQSRKASPRMGRQKQLTIPDEAVVILERYAPGRHKEGEFLGRLLFEHQAREEERARLGHVVPLGEPDVSLVK